MNPALEMLVGGVQSVTLGDEEANRRGVQKTVFERKGPSTFSCGVEIISKTELRIHCNLEATLDAVLSGRNPRFEVRKINWGLGSAVEAGLITCNLSETHIQREIQHASEMSDITSFSEDMVSEENSGKDMDGLCIFLYGVVGKQRSASTLISIRG